MPEPPSQPRILITGTTGQVGHELLQTLAPLGTLFAPARAELNLADEASIRAAIRRIQPHWIVNAAAYTAVDKAESEPDKAFAINAEALRAIGEEASARSANVLHFSTDYVFNGEGTRHWQESDPTAPLSVYGHSKLAGEQALAASGAAHIILRTSWVYGVTGHNFLRTILRLARERPELRIVDDQHGAPTWSRDLALLAAHILARNPAPEHQGIYHATASGEATWAAFAQQALDLARLRSPEVPLARILPIATAEYPTPAQRPRNSRLNTERLESTFAWKLPPWQDSLHKVLHQIEASTS